MILLRRAQILMLHADLVSEFGGSHGLRDHALFESALDTPTASFGGQDLFPTVIEKSARLGFGLIANHPFIDGNKRVGIHAMLVQLALNGVEIEATEAEVVALGLLVASGEMSFEQVVGWIKAHAVREGGPTT